MLLPNANSNRIAFGTALFGGVMVYYSWQADLISSLTVKQNTLPFNNLDELAATSKYKVILAQGTSTLDLFRYSSDPARNRIWKEKIAPYVNELPSYDGLLDSLSSNPFAVTFVETYVADVHPAYHDCKIIPAGVLLYGSSLSWATGKKYPFYEALNYHITKLKEIGEVQRNSKKYHPLEKQICKDHSGESVTINQSFFAFSILLVGLLGSFLFLVLEKLLPHEKMDGFLTFGNRKFKERLMKYKRISSVGKELTAGAHDSEPHEKITTAKRNNNEARFM